MRKIRIFALGLSLVHLSACGGSSGGVGSTPAPAPSPSPSPSPAPETISALTTDHAFAALGSSAHFTVSTADDKIVVASGASENTLSIRYDAATRTYTIQSGAVSESFAPGDIPPGGQAPGEVFYGKTDSKLRLITTPRTNPDSGNSYVGMGLWQRDSAGAGQTNTDLTTFVYGFETPAASVPRGGSARWITDMYGWLNIPGQLPSQIPSEFKASGVFDVDFASGKFSGSSQGIFSIQYAGTLGSGNSLGGTIRLTGLTSPLNGTLAGKFFGPNAEELGAQLYATDGSAVFTGAMTGQRGDIIRTQALQDVSPSQKLNATASYFHTLSGSNIPTGTIFSTGFDAFAFSRDGKSGIIAAGTKNSEVDLTYAGFSNWTLSSSQLHGLSERYSYQIVYGVETPGYVMAARTGTASYSGAVHGEAGNVSTTRYDLAGTSNFLVDFGAATYSGTLNLTANPPTGNSYPAVNLGSIPFGGAIFAGSMTRGSFTGYEGGIQPKFYGPNGEEIGAPFHLVVPQSVGTLYVAGAALARQAP